MSKTNDQAHVYVFIDNDMSFTPKFYGTVLEEIYSHVIKMKKLPAHKVQFDETNNAVMIKHHGPVGWIIKIPYMGLILD
jgi:hypothetical protein